MAWMTVDMKKKKEKQTKKKLNLINSTAVNLCLRKVFATLKERGILIIIIIEILVILKSLHKQD